MRRRFRPPRWSWIALIPALALLLALGTWQLQRGQAKAELVRRMEQASASAPVPFSAALLPARDDAYRHVRARGTYDTAHQLLLDNQSHAHRPGYHVLTPLRLAGGGLVLVNRGWIPQDAQGLSALQMQPPAGPQEVRGLLRPLPRPGLRLAADNCAGDAWPRVVQYPTHEDLVCLYGVPVFDAVILLDPGAPHGYVREWSIGVAVPPSRHYGYAAQWYAFAATLLFLFIRLSLRT